MKLLFTYFFFFFLIGCALPKFSFKPAGKGNQKEIPANTIQIDFFENNSSLASSTVSASFTESLRDLMQAQTSLDLVSENGDVVFSGNIKEYKISPVNIQAGSEAAAQNRLTMVVTVNEYFSLIDSLALNNHSFSAFVDYNSNVYSYCKEAPVFIGKKNTEGDLVLAKDLQAS